MDLAMDEDVNVVLGKTIIPIYLCPSSDHSYGLEKAPHSLPLADPTMQFAVIDYNGLNGANRLFTAAPSSAIAGPRRLCRTPAVADRQLRRWNLPDHGCCGNGQLRTRGVDSRPAALQPSRLCDQLAKRIQQRPEFRLSRWVQFAGDEPGTGEGHRRHVGDFELSPRRSERSLRRRVRPFLDQLRFRRDAHRLDHPRRARGDPESSY